MRQLRLREYPSEYFERFSNVSLAGTRYSGVSESDGRNRRERARARAG